MIKGLLGLAFVGLITITGYEVWSHYVRVEQPQALLISEDALATDDLVALGSVSIDYAVRLEQAFLGAPDTIIASQLNDTPLGRLQSAGIHPRRDLSHLVFGLYLDADETAGYAVALLGRFDKARVLSWLRGEYAVTAVGGGDSSLWQLRKQHVDTCSWSRPWQLYFGEGLILAADPGRMPALLGRFADRADALRDLGRWRDFRATQVGSLALFVPDDTPSTGNPFLQQPVSQAHDALDDFREVYFGLGVWPLPFRARFELMLAGADAGAAGDTAARWQAALAASKQQWSEQMPTVARLHDALSVTARDSALLMQASVDKAWLADAAKIPQELVGLMLGSAGLSVQPSDGAAPAPERIDEHPTPYLPQVTVDALPLYRAEPPFVPEVDAVSGPFGIRLTAVQLAAGDDPGLELTLTGTHRGIPNLGRGAQRVQLYVDSVTDAAGTELLREESCGSQRNDQPADLDDSHFGDSQKGDKTVRLRPGVRHADIHRIRGHVKLLLPVETERLQLASLDEERSVDRDGVRVVVRRSAGDTLAYQVYGETRRLLELRGLNAAAQPLSQTSSMYGDFLFGEGQSGNRSFAGQVAAAELILAVRDVEKRFPFELVTRRPRASNNESEHEPVSIAPYSLAQLRRDFPSAPAVAADAGEVAAETETGPFRVVLNRVRSFFGLQTRFTVYAPAVPGLAGNLSGLALELTGIQNADGEELIGGQSQRDALRLSEDWRERTRLQGQASLRFESEADASQVRSLSGRLHLGLPGRVQAVSLAGMEVGKRVVEGGTDILLSRVDDKGFALAFGSEQPALVAVNAYNAAGASLWVVHPRLENKDGRWIGEFQTHGSAERVEVLLAVEQEQQAFPFELEIAP